MESIDYDAQDLDAIYKAYRKKLVAVYLFILFGAKHSPMLSFK